jgi:hypothetical protein
MQSCDTPRCIHVGMHIPAMLSGMSDYGRRASRAQNSPTVLLQGRVLPETRQAFKDAAEASGVSVAYYLDALAQNLEREHGGMPLVEDPRRLNNVELPIPAA